MTTVAHAHRRPLLVAVQLAGTLAVLAAAEAYDWPFAVGAGLLLALGALVVAAALAGSRTA